MITRRVTTESPDFSRDSIRRQCKFKLPSHSNSCFSSSCFPSKNEVAIRRKVFVKYAKGVKYGHFYANVKERKSLVAKWYDQAPAKSASIAAKFKETIAYQIWLEIVCVFILQRSQKTSFEPGRTIQLSPKSVKYGSFCATP